MNLSPISFIIDADHLEAWEMRIETFYGHVQTVAATWLPPIMDGGVQVLSLVNLQESKRSVLGWKILVSAGHWYFLHFISYVFYNDVWYVWRCGKCPTILLLHDEAVNDDVVAAHYYVMIPSNLHLLMFILKLMPLLSCTLWFTFLIGYALQYQCNE